MSWTGGCGGGRRLCFLPCSTARSHPSVKLVGVGNTWADLLGARASSSLLEERLHIVICVCMPSPTVCLKGHKMRGIEWYRCHSCS